MLLVFLFNNHKLITQHNQRKIFICLITWLISCGAALRASVIMKLHYSFKFSLTTWYLRDRLTWMDLWLPHWSNVTLPFCRGWEEITFIVRGWFMIVSFFSYNPIWKVVLGNVLNHCHRSVDTILSVWCLGISYIIKG